MRRIALGGSAALGLALATPVGALIDIPLPPVPPAAVANIPVGLLVDVNSGRILYAREPDRRFAPASMAKGRLAAATKLRVTDATAHQWRGRGTSLYLKGGQEIDIDTLLHGIATVSANDASVVLAEGYAGDVARWCALMNEHARRLGMANSHFATPSGWPDGGKTYVSAQDLVTLGEALVTRHPELYRRYFGQKHMTFEGIAQQSHDPTVGVVRGADGIKTGYTDEAGYNFLGSAERDGQRLMMVVGGARSEAKRAAASRALLEWGFSEWKGRVLFKRGTTVAEARVQNGDARTVPLVADRSIGDIMPNAQGGGGSTLVLTYRGPLVAPISKGAKVAELEVQATEGKARRLPLYAGASVGEAGPLDRLVNGIVGLFS